MKGCYCSCTSCHLDNANAVESNHTTATTTTRKTNSNNNNYYHKTCERVQPHDDTDAEIHTDNVFLPTKRCKTSSHHRTLFLDFTKNFYSFFMLLFNRQLFNHPLKRFFIVVLLLCPRLVLPTAATTTTTEAAAAASCTGADNSQNFPQTPRLPGGYSFCMNLREPFYDDQCPDDDDMLLLPPTSDVAACSEAVANVKNQQSSNISTSATTTTATTVAAATTASPTVAPTTAAPVEDKECDAAARRDFKIFEEILEKYVSPDDYIIDEELPSARCNLLKCLVSKLMFFIAMSHPVCPRLYARRAV